MLGRGRHRDRARGDEIVPEPSRRQRWWRRARPVVAVALVLAVLWAGCGFVGERRRHCADGVERRGPRDECVGLTDGRHDFEVDIADITDAIRGENEDVERLARTDGRRYVTVVHMLPITVATTDISPLTSVRHELIGAFLAQHAANHDRGGDASPLVRLLVANTGSRSGQWEAVVGQILDRADEENIVAVTGLGESLGNTRRAIDRLSAAGMPMVGSVITADNLSQIPGLVRVVAPNRDEVAAVLSDVRDAEDPAETAFLVADETDDDHYAATLRQEFTEQAERIGLRVSQPELFDSSKQGTANQFPPIVDNICDARPDFVFFAGRGTQLRQFVVALDGRGCERETPVRVLTGDDASSIVGLDPDSDEAEQLARALRDGNLKVEYTALAHSGSWEERPDLFSDQARAKLDPSTGLLAELFPGESLDDGQIIVSFDAVHTAATAAQQALGQDDRELVPDDIVQWWNRLHGDSGVRGASGCISLLEDGNPDNKVMPIVRITPEGADFERLTAPRGLPASQCGSAPAPR